MYPGGFLPGARWRRRSSIQWQPLITLATDTHDHDELSGSNLVPITLLPPPSDVPPPEGTPPLRTMMGMGR